MTVLRHDEHLLTGMPASPVALSCAGTGLGIAAVGTLLERNGFTHLLAGVRPRRKLGPEELSHEYLSCAVMPARNVV